MSTPDHNFSRPSPELEFMNVDTSSKLKLPLFTARVEAGFPSPADDYIEDKLDLNELLINHPAATFFVRVSGHSMAEAGIHAGDILVVDRAEEPADRQVVIAALNGELTVKRIRKKDNKLFLMPEPENSNSPDQPYAPIEVTESMDFEVWGVVTYVIHDLQQPKKL
jgi:DNA polymerase V